MIEPEPERLARFREELCEAFIAAQTESLDSEITDLMEGNT